MSLPRLGESGIKYGRTTVTQELLGCQSFDRWLRHDIVMIFCPPSTGETGYHMLTRWR